MNKTLSCGLALAAMAIPLPLHAQSNDEGLANLVPNLILNGITLPGADNPGRPHAGHFTLGNPTFGGSQPASQVDVPSMQAVAAFNDRLRAQLANFPLGSSTGGFTFSFDESSGIYTRNTESFGPSFTERAATIGKRKLSIGGNYQHTSFETFAGQNLRDGSIKFYLPHTDCCAAGAPPPSLLNPGFESDILQADLLLKATTDTFAFFANYGVTDRFDVGVAIPLTRIDLEANVHAHIIRLSTIDGARVHTFVEGQDVSERTFSQAGTATGLGDIVLRTKYNFLNRGTTGISGAVDVRLPTGDESDLLGLGTAQAKFFLILSSTRGRVSPHVNLGFTVSGEGERETRFQFQPLGVSDEMNYAGGIEFVAHPRLTLLADVLGRTLFDAGKVGLQTKTFAFRTPSGADTSVGLQTSSINPNTGAPYEQLALRAGDLTQVLGSTGFKYNAGPNLLLVGNILFPLNNQGLRDRVTFALGFDYAF